LLGDDDEEDEFAPRFTSCMAISALPILICYMLLGASAYFGIEDVDDEELIEWQDAMYWAVLTISTAGLGDRVPTSDGGKILTIFFILIGLIYIASCFGMLSFQLTHMSFLHAAPGDPKEKRWLDSHLKHLIAPVIIVSINLLIMAFVMHFNEEADWVTSFYWATATLSSVGYGDPLIQKDSTRTFLTFFLLWGVISVAWALGKVAEVVRLTEEDRKIKHFAEHGVTKKLIREMDTDEDGAIECPEFLVYMLLKLNRVRRSDVDELKNLFALLDTDGSGSIDENDIDTIKKEKMAAKDTIDTIEKEKMGSKDR